MSSPPRRDRAAFSFDARYGRLIRKAGIGTIPFALFYYQAELDLSPQEVWLIGYVLSHRWTAELPFPAVRELARRSGVSTKTIEKYKRGIEEKGYLDVVRRTRADGGNTSIGWDFSPLFDRVDRLITRDIEQWVQRNPQFLGEELPDDGVLADDVDDQVDNAPPVRRPVHGAVVGGVHGGGEGGVHGAGKRGSHGPANTGRTHEEESVDREQTELESVQSVKNQGEITRAAAPSISKPEHSIGFTDGSLGWRETGPAPVSPFIDRVVADYSARLHDAPKSVRANCTRARRLWATSGLPEDDFVGLLHEAYRRTQENSHRIRKTAPGGPYGTKNKMPYFLSVLGHLTAENAPDS